MHLSSPVLALLMAIRFHIAHYTCFWSRVEQRHPCYFTLHTNAHTKSNLPSGSMAYGILMVTPRPAGPRNRCNLAFGVAPHAVREKASHCRPTPHPRRGTTTLLPPCRHHLKSQPRHMRPTPYFVDPPHLPLRMSRKSRCVLRCHPTDTRHRGRAPRSTSSRYLVSVLHVYCALFIPLNSVLATFFCKRCSTSLPTKDHFHAHMFTVHKRGPKHVHVPS